MEKEKIKKKSNDDLHNEERLVLVLFQMDIAAWINFVPENLYDSTIRTTECEYCHPYDFLKSKRQEWMAISGKKHE